MSASTVLSTSPPGDVRRCARCILPETYPGITFHEGGVCNYCLAHRNRKCRGEAALQTLIEPYRNRARRGGSRDYDCVVSLSGGRDSTYVAYCVVRSFGFHPLLYTFDNGFMPDQTRKNTTTTAQRLGLDHVILKSQDVRDNVKHVLSCWMHRPSPAMIGILCGGCKTGYARGLLQTARDRQIPLAITGSGEPQGRSFAQSLLNSGHDVDTKLPLIIGTLSQVAQNPRYLCNAHFLFGSAREYFYRFLYSVRLSRSRKGTGAGHKRLATVSLFRYIRWDEQEIVSTIEGQLGWKKPAYSQSSWRADCAVNELKNYLYMNTLGFTKHDTLLSGMVRRGLLSREQALQRLGSDNVFSRTFLAQMLADLGFDLDELDAALERYQRGLNNE